MGDALFLVASGTRNDTASGPNIIKAVDLAELRTAVNAVRALAGLGAFVFTDAATPGTVIKKVHITELGSALDEGRTALTLGGGDLHRSGPRRPRGEGNHHLDLRLASGTPGIN